MPDSVEISCPAKTFVIGEYSVLDGGSAIIINTAPRFSCRIYKKKSRKSQSNYQFSPNSPVYKWMHDHQDIFTSYDFEWRNPYKDKGGLGFSSAQFNILYAYTQISKGKSLDQVKPADLMQSYLNLHFEGCKPSGADILSQWQGGVCFFEQNPLSLRSIMSALPDLDYLTVHTGHRTLTHEHLKDLKLPDVSDLKNISEESLAFWEQGKSEDFIHGLNTYGEALHTMGFSIPSVQKLVKELKSLPEVKGAKGCGAMTAEVIILFFKKEDRDSLKKKIQHLDIISDGSAMTYGTAIHEDGAFSKEASL